MTEPQELSGRECPQCGQPMHRWPTLESSGYIFACPDCGFEESAAGSSEAERTKDKPPGDPQVKQPRLHDLLAQQDQPNEWPEELLDSLPADKRQLFESKGKPKNKTPVSADLEKRLRGYGYILAEDGQGARLLGEGPKPGTGDLSPLDVVRLAAELEGGLPEASQRSQCPNCQAVLPPNADHCQWCGFNLDEPPPTQEE